MKDSQHKRGVGAVRLKYIKANNERFSTKNGRDGLDG